jgi:Class II flagellar assembly regulator
MRITGPGSPNTLRRSGDVQRRTATGQAFEPADTGAARRTAQAMGTAPLTSVGALLALQSVDDALTGRRRAIRRGNEVLDTLDDLKLDLLAGTTDAAKLRRLVRLMEDRPRTGDADVDGVLDEIELRARVELAKRDAI